MKIFSVLFLLLNSVTGFSAHPYFRIPQDTVQKGTFILHKFQQPIGKEKYALVQTKDSLILYSDFKFNDRGTDVPLKTSLAINTEGVPLRLKINGKTSRVSGIDSEVRIHRDSAFTRVDAMHEHVKVKAPYFTISGYSPVAVQMALVKYWNKQGKPAFIHTYPSGKLVIQFHGTDTIAVSGKKQVLERYFIEGLIWGKELLWTDQAGNLITLFTNDAEGDKFEAIHDAYVDQLPYFIRKAALYGMQNMKLTTKPVSNPVLVLKGGNILDVITGNTIPNTTIIMKNGRIEQIGAVSKIKIPKGATVIDISGKTVLPGLWDMHAHFQQVEWGPAYLAAGVTTVRDCGNEFDFINAVEEAINTKKGLGPNILKAGIIDGDSQMALGIVRVNKSEEAHAVVQRYKANGFDQIKIYSSVKPEMIKAIADEAHKAGLKVTGHVPEGVTVAQAIELGQDQINHFSFIYRAMLTDMKEFKINVNDSASKAVLKLLKEKNIVVDPTLGVYEWMLRPLDQPMDAFEPGINHMPEVLKAIFKNIGLPADVAAKRKVILEGGKQIVKAMHEQGITIVAGTDMMIPGYSLYREIELYHEAGLTPIDAIRTATIVPAKVMNLEKESGSIHIGKKADLIVVDGNPLEKISNLRNVIRVIKDGTVYDPAALRKLVDFN